MHKPCLQDEYVSTQEQKAAEKAERLAKGQSARKAKVAIKAKPAAKAEPATKAATRAPVACATLPPSNPNARTKGFDVFVDHHKPTLQYAHPLASANDLRRMLSTQWKQMDCVERAPYIARIATKKEVATAGKSHFEKRPIEGTVRDGDVGSVPVVELDQGVEEDDGSCADEAWDGKGVMDLGFNVEGAWDDTHVGDVDEAFRVREPAMDIEESHEDAEEDEADGIHAATRRLSFSDAIGSADFRPFLPIKNGVSPPRAASNAATSRPAASGVLQLAPPKGVSKVRSSLATVPTARARTAIPGAKVLAHHEAAHVLADLNHGEGIAYDGPVDDESVEGGRLISKTALDRRDSTTGQLVSGQKRSIHEVHRGLERVTQLNQASRRYRVAVLAKQSHAEIAELMHSSLHDLQAQQEKNQASHKENLPSLYKAYQGLLKQYSDLEERDKHLDRLRHEFQQESARLESAQQDGVQALRERMEKEVAQETRACEEELARIERSTNKRLHENTKKARRDMATLTTLTALHRDETAVEEDDEMNNE